MFLDFNSHLQSANALRIMKKCFLLPVLCLESLKLNSTASERSSKLKSNNSYQPRRWFWPRLKPTMLFQPQWPFFLSSGSFSSLQEVKRNHVLYSTTYTIAFKSRSPASSWPLLKLLVLYFMVGFAASKSTKMAQKFLQQVWTCPIKSTSYRYGVFLDTEMLAG